MIKNFISKITSKIIKQLNQLDYQPPILNARLWRIRRLPCFVVSITSRCNFNCPHCLRSAVDKNKTLAKDLRPSIFETILKEGKKINLQTVSLSGGEPILHPQLGELISLINKYNYKFNFVSNGWLYKEYWEAIKQNLKNLEFLFLSLDGVTAEIHDAVRNKPGSFQKLMEAIEFYKGKKIPIIITFCVTKENYHQIELLPEFCLEHGVNFIKWATVIPVQNKSNALSGDKVLSDVQRSEAIQKIFNLQRRFKNQCSFSTTSSFFSFLDEKMNKSRAIDFCFVLSGHVFYIDHDGGMLFCCDINRECLNKPLIQELGFEESLKITLDVVNEIKKKFVSEMLDNPHKINRICDFCNNNVESCLDLVMRQRHNFPCG